MNETTPQSSDYIAFTGSFFFITFLFDISQHHVIFTVVLQILHVSTGYLGFSTVLALSLLHTVFIPDSSIF